MANSNTNYVEGAFIKGLEYKAILEDIGSSMIEGEDLKTNISVNNISLWTLMEPSLATYTFPEINKNSSSFNFSYFKMFVNYFVSRESFTHPSREPYKYNHDERTVLFVCFEPRQLEGSESLVNKIRESGYQVILVSTSSLENEFSKIFDATIFVEDIYKNSFKRKINATEREFTSKLYKVFKESSEGEGQVKNKFLKFFLSKIKIHYYITKNLKYIFLADSIISKFNQPILFSFDETDPRIRAFFMCAKRNNIKSVYSQFGLQSKRDVELSYSIASDLCFFGESYFDLANEMGISDRNFHATGCLRYDQLLKPNKEILLNLRSDLPKLSKEKIILFASQPEFGDSFFLAGSKTYLINEFIEACNRENIFLIIKAHPDEDKDALERQFSNLKSNYLVIKDEYAFSYLMEISDLLVTFFSTCILESIILNKPIILLGENSNEFYDFYSIEAGARRCSNLKGILEAMNFDIGLTENKRNMFLQKHLLNDDGLSYMRLAKVVLGQS